MHKMKTTHWKLCNEKPWNHWELLNPIIWTQWKMTEDYQLQLYESSYQSSNTSKYIDFAQNSKFRIVTNQIRLSKQN